MNICLTKEFPLVDDSKKIFYKINLDVDKNISLILPSNKTLIIDKNGDIETISKEGLYFIDVLEKDANIYTFKERDFSNDKVYIDKENVYGNLYFSWKVTDIMKFYKHKEEMNEEKVIVENIAKQVNKSVESFYNEDFNIFTENISKFLIGLCNDYGIIVENVSFTGTILSITPKEEKTLTVFHDEEKGYYDNEDDVFLPVNKCKECGYEPPSGVYPKFCPECGAKWIK